ncbi:hypothetical protein K438DRAFT_1953036 [Mycena galopus ATCC 62051]|nr:hypothetical protein K438DRAFT_1953036 [Mycena galopus ATCC 62051]
MRINEPSLFHLQHCMDGWRVQGAEERDAPKKRVWHVIRLAPNYIIRKRPDQTPAPSVYERLLVNVLKCLPSHLWEEETVSISQFSVYSDVKRFIGITGPIHPEDWGIPQAYAVRIQRLELGTDRTGHELPAFHDIFDMINSGLSGDHLCPNLKHLLFLVNGSDDAMFSIFS